MKLLLALFFISTLTLNAAYLRTIYMASFLTQKSAELFSKKAEKRFKKDKVFSAMQEEIGFDFKVVKSGKYFLVKLEPFTNSESLQVAIDIISKKYKDIYVKKVDDIPLSCDEKIEQIKTIQPKAIEKIKIVETVKEIKTPAKKVFVTVFKDSKKTTLLKWLLFFTLLCIGGLLIALFKYKKELKIQKELFKNQEMQEKDLFSDIKFDDIDLDLDDLDDDVLKELDNIK